MNQRLTSFVLMFYEFEVVWGDAINFVRTWQSEVEAASANLVLQLFETRQAPHTLKIVEH